MSTPVITIRRRWISYLSDVVVMFFIFGRIYRGYTEWDFLDTIHAAVGVGFFVNLISNCFRPNYIVADATHLTIYHQFFVKSTIAISEIQRIELNVMVNSLIHLVDGTKIQFNYFQINESDFNQLKSHLQVPIE